MEFHLLVLLFRGLLVLLLFGHQSRGRDGPPLPGSVPIQNRILPPVLLLELALDFLVYFKQLYVFPNIIRLIIIQVPYFKMIHVVIYRLIPILI